MRVSSSIQPPVIRQNSPRAPVQTAEPNAVQPIKPSLDQFAASNERSLNDAGYDLKSLARSDSDNRENLLDSVIIEDETYGPLSEQETDAGAKLDENPRLLYQTPAISSQFTRPAFSDGSSSQFQDTEQKGLQQKAIDFYNFTAVLGRPGGEGELIGIDTFA